MIGSIKKESSYKGMPCYEVSENPTTVNGYFGNANNIDSLPSCVSLRNNDLAQAMQQQNSPGKKFDPVNWVKENPLYAAGAALLIYFGFIKK